MKSKGFMMAEVVVVSAIALVGMVVLYGSYNKIYSKYMERISYNDMKAMNRAIFYRDYLIEDCDSIYENCKINVLMNNAKNGDKLQNVSANVTLLEANDDVKAGKIVAENVWLYYNQKQNISSSIFNGKTVNRTFREYVDYLNSSRTLNKANYVMLLERCYTEDDCKYAYLEVYDR